MAEATDFSYPFLTVSIVLGTNRVDSSTKTETYSLSEPNYQSSNRKTLSSEIKEVIRIPSNDKFFTASMCK